MSRCMTLCLASQGYHHLKRDLAAARTLQRAEELKDELVRLRRQVHMYPELGFQEVKTAALVAETLRGLGIRVEEEVGKTGVVGYLGEGPPVIGIRADMDALPVQEANEVPYKSQVPGVMHACGHDTHEACLLGVAMLLHDLDLPGQVRFLFQPCEEASGEEGKSGAQRMIEGGALEGVDAVIALHVDSSEPAGTIQIGEEGYVSASVDTFYATITGKGCHGAYPHKGIDPIFILGQVINAVQGIASRRMDPTKPAVISIGSVHGGDAPNVITDKVELSGTIRSLDEEVRRQLIQELKSAFRVVEALGGEYELTVEEGLVSARQDLEMAALVREVVTDLLGADGLCKPKLGLGGEDFGLMMAGAKGCMFGLGAKPEGEPRPHHSPKFDVDEAALPIGAAVLAETARRYLERAAKPSNAVE